MATFLNTSLTRRETRQPCPPEVTFYKADIFNLFEGLVFFFFVELG